MQTQGNVLAATAFLQGLSSRDLRPDELDYHDADYEVLITVRAVKACLKPTGRQLESRAAWRIGANPHVPRGVPRRRTRRFGDTPSRYGTSPVRCGWLAALGYQTDRHGRPGARACGQAPRCPSGPVSSLSTMAFRGGRPRGASAPQAHRFTAIFFLVAGLMGATSRWMIPELGMELPPHDWDTARTLGAEGFHFGAHSVSHPRLAGLDSARCRTELIDARKLIEEELNRAGAPPGLSVRRLMTAAVQATWRPKQGYATACSTRPGLSGAEDDLLALHRVSVYGHDSLFDFISRLRTGPAVRERSARRSAAWPTDFGSPAPALASCAFDAQCVIPDVPASGLAAARPGLA